MRIGMTWLFVAVGLCSSSAAIAGNAVGMVHKCAHDVYDPGSRYVASAGLETKSAQLVDTDSVYEFTQFVAQYAESGTLKVDLNAAATAEYDAFTSCLAAQEVVPLSVLWLAENGLGDGKAGVRYAEKDGVRILSTDGVVHDKRGPVLRLQDPESVAAKTCFSISVPVVEVGDDYAIAASRYIDFPVPPGNPMPGVSCAGDPCSSCEQVVRGPGPGEDFDSYVYCRCRAGHGRDGKKGFCNRIDVPIDPGFSDGGLVTLTPRL